MINYIKTQQKTYYENVRISDIFYDERTKITESLIKENQILDPVLHNVKMWKKHNNKPHSVTMEIRGNKGLFAYFRKKSIQKICLPLKLLLCTFMHIMHLQHYSNIGS